MSAPTPAPAPPAPTPAPLNAAADLIAAAEDLAEELLELGAEAPEAQGAAAALVDAAAEVVRAARAGQAPGIVLSLVLWAARVGPSVAADVARIVASIHLPWQRTVAELLSDADAAVGEGNERKAARLRRRAARRGE